LLALAVGLLCAASTACGGKESAGGGRTSSGSKDAHVTKFKLGRSLGTDGEAGNEIRSFTKGDKVYASFAIVDAQDDSQAKAVWVTQPGGTKVSEESKPLARGTGLVNFTAETASWEPGTYRVETWVVEPGKPPRRLGSADFSVTAAAG
jgi:hypothetical protein